MWFSTVLLLAAMTTAWPGEVPAAQETYEGKIVSVAKGKIAIINKTGGDNEQFDVADDAQISLNGKPAKLNELNTGDVVKLTVKDRKGTRVATIVEARNSE